MTGKELKALRRKRRMTQKEVAERIGTEPTNISVMEKTRRELAMIWPAYNERLESVFYGD